MSAPRSASHAVLLHGLLLGGLLPAVAWAQETSEPEFTPSDQELNRDLDESLRDEYAEEDAPPPPPPVHDHDHDRDHDADRLRLRFGGLAAYAWTDLTRVKLAHREGRSGGREIDFGRDGRRDRSISSYEFDNGAGFYRAWIGLGRYVSLQGAWFHGRFRDANVLTSRPGGVQGFTYGRTTFRDGEVLQVSHDLRVADYDVVVHPLNLSWIRLDVSLGARYVYWGTKLERRSGRYAKEQESIEGLIPMVGLGLELSPVRPLTVFLRGRVGSIELERRGGYRGRGNDRRYVEEKSREHTSAELDGGLTVTIEGIGIILGAKVQYIELERTVPARSEHVEGYASSLYAGVILNF